MVKVVDDVSVDEMDIPTFRTKKGAVPIWDDPTLRGYRKHPEKYKPMTTIQGSIHLERNGMIDEKDIRLLKVLGDAIAPNEDQLRRLMAFSGMSASDVSSRLKKFRMFGLAERWYVDTDFDEWERRPPAPHSLGFSGYKYLKHYYNECFFMDPERWDRYGIKAIKRYVSLNELRCFLIERSVLSRWVWQGIIAKNPKIESPLGVAQIETPKATFHMVIEKPQQGMDYIRHIKSRLEKWVKPYKSFGNLPIRHIDSEQAVIILSVSTQSMMEHIYQDIPIESYPFPVWFYSEEDATEHGVEYAFYLSQDKQLKRIKLDFLVG